MKKFLLLAIAPFLMASYSPIVAERAFSAVGSGGAGETLYLGGFYKAPAADANLTQAGASTTLGSANHPYAGHVFIVAGAAGTASGGSGTVTLRVTGTSFTDSGTRAGSDTEDLTTDITSLATDQYLETAKKFIGQVTIALVCTGACTHTTYALDFNYGQAKYSDFQNRDFEVSGGECAGLAKSADTGFEIEFIKHTTTGWTYSASAFVPGPAAGFTLTGDYSTESDLAAGEYFAWKRVFSPASYVSVAGSGTEGFIIRITTGTGNAIEFINCEVSIIKSPYQP